MKQLVIGVVLAVLLVGCNKTTVLSLSKLNTVEELSKDSSFTKIEIEREWNQTPEVILKFYTTPKTISAFNIKTDDVSALGGYLRFNTDKTLCGVYLTAKGKKSYQNILTTVKSDSSYVSSKQRMNLEPDFGHVFENIKNGVDVTVYYDPFADITTLAISQCAGL